MWDHNGETIDYHFYDEAQNPSMMVIPNLSQRNKWADGKPSIHDVLHNFVINEPYSVTEIEFVIPKTSQMKGFLVVHVSNRE